MWRGNPFDRGENIMAEPIKNKVEDAAHNIAETASQVGHKVNEKLAEAADWVKDKAHMTAASLNESTGAVGSVADIREHQDVFASCGTKVGKVDHVEGDSIKLTKNDSPDGQHHLIPLSWVAKVHDHIHLNKDHREVQREWKPA